MSYFDLFRLDIVIDIMQFRRNKEMQMEGWKKWSTLYSTSAFGQFVHSLNTVRPKRIHISNIISGKCYFQENSKSGRKLELANWNIKSLHHLHQMDQAYLYIRLLYLNFQKKTWQRVLDFSVCTSVSACCWCKMCFAINVAQLMSWGVISIQRP